MNSTFKKIAVVGAGSMGGLLGAKLALGGHDVTFIARGATLEALRRGFTMIDAQGVRHTPAVKAAAAEEAGPFDLVILCLKAHQIAAAAKTLPRLFHDNTPVLAVLNGIPWWYFHKNGGAFDGRALASVDPNGAIARAIDGRRVIGGVIYAAAKVIAPGVVHVTDTLRFIIGEPDGSASARTAEIADMFNRTGFNTAVSTEIRSDIWTKVWGNASFNPVSALTGAGLAGIARDKGACDVVRAIMKEVEEVVNRLGLKMKMGLQQRIDVTESLGDHKTSMLQDIEARRMPETDANMGAVAEIAKLVGVPTPMLETIHTTTRLLGRAVTA
ncbi:MAG: ketopantoate reductase family protein [Rhodospirillaceae bacterium]